jgi:flagellar hook-basal body complex protein FliE
MAIDPLTTRIATTPLTKIGGVAGGEKAGESSGSFANSLKQLIDSVEDSAGDANDAIAGMVTGKGDVHHAMIALQRADMMLSVTVQIRNKLVQAYQDVMRMPV